MLVDPQQMQPAVFLHIPKTAGSSFMRTSRNMFGPHRVVRLTTIDEITSRELGRLLADRDVACIGGHIPFHMIAPWQQWCRVFTVLREPVARVMSLFRYVRAMPPAEQQQLGLRSGFAFEDFIASRHPAVFPQIHDGMVRMLSGDADLFNPGLPKFWDAVALPRARDAALHTLESIGFGLTEDIGNTMRLARAAWGLPYELSISHDNASQAVPAAPDSAHDLEIAACNTMDCDFYERERQLFADRCRGLALPAGFATVFVAEPGEAVAAGKLTRLQGFHEVEPGGWAWLDCPPPSRIHFRLAAAAVSIRMHCRLISESYPIGEIAIEVNGERVGARAQSVGGPWCTLETEPAGPLGPVNVLSIRPPCFVPVRNVDPASTGPRSLAIALARITFLS